MLATDLCLTYGWKGRGLAGVGGWGVCFTCPGLFLMLVLWADTKRLFAVFACLSDTLVLLKKKKTRKYEVLNRPALPHM